MLFVLSRQSHRNPITIRIIFAHGGEDPQEECETYSRGGPTWSHGKLVRFLWYPFANQVLSTSARDFRATLEVPGL